MNGENRSFWNEYAVQVRCGLKIKQGISIIHHLILGLVGEAGEVADAVKKSEYEGHPAPTFEKMAEELGDVLWYLQGLATQIGTSLPELAVKNVAKLKKRHGSPYSVSKLSGEFEVVSEKKDPRRSVYLAGPMSGKPGLNFAAFDAAKEAWERRGWRVVSPADLDRTLDGSTGNPDEVKALSFYMRRDIAALLTVDAIAFLPGSTQSNGATRELVVADSLGLEVYDAITFEKIETRVSAVSWEFPYPWKVTAPPVEVVFKFPKKKGE